MIFANFRARQRSNFNFDPFSACFSFSKIFRKVKESLLLCSLFLLPKIRMWRKLRVAILLAFCLLHFFAVTADRWTQNTMHQILHKLDFWFLKLFYILILFFPHYSFLRYISDFFPKRFPFSTLRNQASLFQLLQSRIEPSDISQQSGN